MYSVLLAVILTSTSPPRFDLTTFGMTTLSNAEQVKEFTEGSMGKTLPSIPSPMNKDEVRFIVRMVLSEMAELVQTVTCSPIETLQMMHECVGADLKMDYKPASPDDPHYDRLVSAQQYDAFVDAWYYMLNAACKKGCNLSKIFDEVHKANMNKRQPDGTWLRREDGKVVKPEGWKEADIVECIRAQQSEGAWK